ncbi:DUF4085 family protein [Fervidibacillus halotolerans]|uniref:DUF4085 family protein n=1 Tax=Fervidibacillus halotolerans TaxID=2980027 RepID=A0A9E8M1S0_9BACI|nr:DUF4085 family protein [Fervidibacillus halotolerans]WAA13310.1 DUF4085 family protein [Fervidibacillus halotolerans]
MLRYFTKDWYEQMQLTGMITTFETDEEWEDFIQSFDAKKDAFEYLRCELRDEKDRLLKVLPETFHPYVHNGSINQPTLPKQIRKQLILWQKGLEEQVEKTMEDAHRHFQHIKNKLPHSFVQLMEEGLHDAQITHIFRKDDYLRLTLNSEGSFSNSAAVVLQFFGIQTETFDLPLKEGMYWLYEEVDVAKDGFKLGVLLDSLCEWEIVAKKFQMTKYFRNEAKFGFEEDEHGNKHDINVLDTFKTVENRLKWKFPKAFQTFLSTFRSGKHNHPFVLLHDVELEIETFLFIDEYERKGDYVPFAKCQNGVIAFHINNKNIVYLDNCEQRVVAQNFENFLQNMYTKEWMDEMELAIQTVPTEQLEEAVFSNQIERNVQAWNTIIQDPASHQKLMEKALIFYLEHEDEEKQMIGQVYLNHIEENHLLRKEIIQQLKVE